MKTIKFLLVSLLIIGQISCSSDDGPESFDIVGNWSITAGFIEPTSILLDMGGMSIPVQISGNFIEIDENNSLSLNGDNTFSSNTGNISLEMDMVVMGESQTQTIEMSDVFGAGTWEVNGRELKIHNENGSTVPFNIDNLSGGILELSANVKNLSLDSGPNPMLDSMDIIVKMKLKRI